MVDKSDPFVSISLFKDEGHEIQGRTAVVDGTTDPNFAAEHPEEVQVTAYVGTTEGQDARHEQLKENDPKEIAEWNTAESGKLERTAGIIVKSSDLLSRANAMIKASRPVSKAPIAKRPPAARKPAGGKKKPCKIA